MPDCLLSLDVDALASALRQAIAGLDVEIDQPYGPSAMTYLEMFYRDRRVVLACCAQGCAALYLQRQESLGEGPDEMLAPGIDIVDRVRSALGV